MRKLIIITVAVLAIAALFLGYMYNYQNRVLGLICDKAGITKNTFEVEIDNKLKRHTFIYWYGETPHPAKKISRMAPINLSSTVMPAMAI